MKLNRLVLQEGLCLSAGIQIVVDKQIQGSVQAERVPACSNIPYSKEGKE